MAPCLSFDQCRYFQPYEATVEMLKLYLSIRILKEFWRESRNEKWRWKSVSVSSFPAPLRNGGWGHQTE